MGLVDYYSSSSDGESNTHHPDDNDEKHRPAKKRRVSLAKSSTSSTPASSKPLPPLPASFHDLYASTVRTTTNDTPSLHQGRKRIIPHVAGNWPSHIYVEWHPTSDQHDLLTSLLDSLRDELDSDNDNNVNTDENDHDNHNNNNKNNKNSNKNNNRTTTNTTNNNDTHPNHKFQLTTFLVSDLGTPLPLHVSLSRPFVLRTEQKDQFLDEAITNLRRGWWSCGGGARFTLRMDELGWYRGSESERSFLVLRVCGTSSSSNSIDSSSSSSSNSSSREKTKQGRRNQELATLLGRCNKLVAGYGQPQLYTRQSKLKLSGEEGKESAIITTAAAATAATVTGGDVDEEAFHVSIAWSFTEPTDEIKKRTAAVFAREEFRKGIIEGIRIPVDGIKVKVGNVVTNIALGEGLEKSANAKGLFGI